MNATLTTEAGNEPVEILDRKTLPGDCPSHGLMRFTFNAAGPLAQFRRCFPDPMPATHRLAFRWVSNEKGQAVLEVGPEVIPAAQYQSAPPDPGVLIGPGGKLAHDLVLRQSADEVAADAERARLMALDIKDLGTYATERHVKVNKKWSQPQLVAEVLKAGKPG